MSDQDLPNYYPVFFFMSKSLKIVKKHLAEMIAGANSRDKGDIFKCDVVEFIDYYKVKLSITKDFRLALANCEMLLFLVREVVAVYDDIDEKFVEQVVGKSVASRNKLLPFYQSMGLSELFLLITDKMVVRRLTKEEYPYSKMRVVVSTGNKRK